MSECMSRIDENIDRKIKNGSKKSTGKKPRSKQPEAPADIPKEDPYQRILRRLREERQTKNPSGTA